MALQLGYVEALAAPLAHDALDFPSKLGGKPLWLAPLHPLQSEAVLCHHCLKPLSLLLQLSAPDPLSGAAYHRVLYVFVCNNTLSSSCSSCFKVFRSQLQDINPFYPSSTDLSANPDLSSAPKIDPSAAKLCIVCGLAGTKQCGKCHSARYCSKDHQILHWPSHKRICSPQQSSDQPFKSKPLFPEYEIVSEDEPETHVDEAQDDPIVNQEKIDQTLKEFNREEKLKKEIEEQFKDVVLEQEEAEDSDAYVDKAFLKFQKRVERSPEQILRYARVNEDPQDAIPLWASDLNKPNPISGESQTIPSCPNCGTDRAFEFQIMPHVLSLLEIDHINPNSMDWGTLLVYTCPKNCVKDGDCGTYMEEVVWKQDFSIDGIGNQIRGIEEKKA